MVSIYIAAMGGWPVFLALAAWFLMAEAARVGATVWLSHWTGVADMPGEEPSRDPFPRLFLQEMTVPASSGASFRWPTGWASPTGLAHRHLRYPQKGVSKHVLFPLSPSQLLSPLLAEAVHMSATVFLPPVQTRAGPPRIDNLPGHRRRRERRRSWCLYSCEVPKPLSQIRVLVAHPPAGAHKAMWYLTIYAGISGAQTLLELVRGFAANFLAVRAARTLHNGMLAKLLRCVPSHD